MITFEDVQAEVLSLMDERPDYVYARNVIPRCVYVEDGQPSCLWGHALVRAGVPIEQVSAINQGESIVGMLRKLDIPATNTQRKWARDSQWSQDQGVAWGKLPRPE